MMHDANARRHRTTIPSRWLDVLATAGFTLLINSISAGIFFANDHILFNRRIDLRQILHQYPAAADIHMPDFGIAHLPLRQPDMQFGGVDQPICG